jgi:hypothetical protein
MATRSGTRWVEFKKEGRRAAPYILGRYIADADPSRAIVETAWCPESSLMARSWDSRADMSNRMPRRGSYSLRPRKAPQAGKRGIQSKLATASQYVQCEGYAVRLSSLEHGVVPIVAET